MVVCFLFLEFCKEEEEDKDCEEFGVFFVEFWIVEVLDFGVGVEVFGGFVSVFL